MATYQKKIAIAEAEILQLQNRTKEYRQKLKAQERNERTRRICQRGGYIEKVLKDTIALTDENFREFIDKTLTTKFSTNVLEEIKAKQENQTVVKTRVLIRLAAIIPPGTRQANRHRLSHLPSGTAEIQYHEAKPK